MRCDATAINLAVCIMQHSQCRQLTTTARATCTASQLGAKMWRGIYSKIVDNAEGCGEGKQGADAEWAAACWRCWSATSDLIFIGTSRGKLRGMASCTCSACCCCLFYFEISLFKCECEYVLANVCV